MPPAADIAALIVIGLASGLLGGLLGFGGSILMIPLLVAAMGRDQHAAQAAAMVVNAAIAIPSAWRHHRAGAVPWTMMRPMILAGIAAILLGVLAGNHVPGTILRRAFALFLFWVIVSDVVHVLRRRKRRHVPARPARGPADGGRAAVVGGGVGFAAGLLGIGGGPIAVPLVQRLCRRSLREAIAASATFMCLTSLVGSIVKVSTLGEVGLAPHDALVDSAAIAPTAILGAWLGAGLTHRLPVRAVRAVFLLVLTGSAIAMLA